MFKRRDKKSGSDSLDKDKLEKEKKKLAKKEAKGGKTSSGSLPTTAASPTSSPTKPGVPATAATATAVPALKLGQQRPAAVPQRPVSATPSQHGPIAVPPRPGNAGHILGAAYNTRSNVPVLRVPLTPHVLPSMTAHRLSADGGGLGLPVQSHSAQPFVPVTERAAQTTTAAGATTTPAWRNGAAGDSGSSLATTAAEAGSQGRLRAASVSSGSGDTATPVATASDRRKSLLSPMTPQQMKAALRNDEFSYFAEVEDKAANARKPNAAPQSATKVSLAPPAKPPQQQTQQTQQTQQPRLTHEQARTMRMASLAAAREGRPRKAQRPIRGLAPGAVDSALTGNDSRPNARAGVFVAQPAKEWKGATRQGTGTLRLNLAALRSQSFRDPSGFATLRRRAPVLASPERASPEEKISNPEEIMLTLGSHKSELKRSERLTRTMSVRDTDLFKLEKQANVIVAAMKKRQVEKREEEEREAKVAKEAAPAVPAEQKTDTQAPPTPVIPEAPPAPAPPPPPPAAGDDKGVTMLAQSEDYEDIFGIALARLERVKGIYRWRIENLRPVLVSNDDVGHAPHMFYKRDCYLILKVTSDEKVYSAGKTNVDPKQEISSASMSYALHYWIGSEASVDKTGSVCFRAVQLNSFIGGRAKHAHEMQGEESPLFVSYYQDHIQAAKAEGLVYLEGGTETAFRKAPKVGVEYDVPRLYRFYFKNGARCIQRVHLELETLDYNEVFLLDTGGMKLYQYNGEKASTRLQYECSDLANLINTHDRKSQATVEIIKRDEDGAFDLNSQFWSYFPPKKPFVTKKEKERLFARHDALFELLQRLEKRVDSLDSKHVGADYAAKQAQLMHAARRKATDGHGPLITGDWHVNEGETEELRDDAMEILCLAGELGEMNVVSKWKQGPDAPKPTRSLLANPERVFIFDCVSEIFVYMGAKSSPLAQQIGAHLAENMRTDTDAGAVRRPAWATVEQIKERSEPVLFKARFDGWVEDDQPKGKSKNACKRAVVDFRGAHERILDGIRERAKKFGSADDRSALPTLDVATLFPVREPKPADNSAAAGQAGGAAGSAAAPEDELVAVEVGILTGGKTFIKINEAEQGLFFSAECYFVLETYKPRPAPQGEGDKPRWRVYFWEGKDASSLRFPMFVLGLQPLLEEKIMRSGSPKPEVQRINQGKEPLAFMKIFDRMISISKGLRKDSLARAQEERLKGKVLMYHCLHTAADDTMRMVEVPATEPSLDSHHSFLVHSFQPKPNAAPDPNGLPELEKKLFVWHGAHSPKATREALMEYVNVLGHEEEAAENKEIEIVVAEERGEDADFWMTLGCDDVPLHRQSPSAAAGGAAAAEPVMASTARLCRFYFEGGGQFKAAEVVDYGQKDLTSGAVYLLDSGRADDPQLHLWMGNDIGETLRVGARHVVAQYASFLLSRASLQRREVLAQAGADKLPPLKKREVVEIAEGQEPSEFTAHFKDWTRAVFVDPYEVRMRERAERERRELLARLEREKRERETKARLEREREERRARGEASDVDDGDDEEVNDQHIGEGESESESESDAIEDDDQEDDAAHQAVPVVEPTVE